MPSTLVAKAGIHPRNPTEDLALIAMARQPADMTALISAIGARLRTQYSDVLNGEIPEKMAELATQLDQPTET
jgi:Anti-sigma factor NepR